MEHCIRIGAMGKARLPNPHCQRLFEPLSERKFIEI